MNVIIHDTAKESCRGDKEGWGDSFSRYPRSLSLYAYTFLYDPFIIGCLPDIPVIKIEDLNNSFFDVDLVIIPHEINKNRSLSFIDQIPTLIVQPEISLFLKLGFISDKNSKKLFHSNNEYWTFNKRSAIRFQYPQQLWYQAIDGIDQDVEILSIIGDWPDLMVKGNTAIYTTDAFHAYDLYRQVPKEYSKGGFTDQFTLNWVKAIRRILGIVKPDNWEERANSNFELRRDFHSYGFARKMVQDLAGLIGNEINFTRADLAIHNGAKMLVQGKADRLEIENSLKEGFLELNRIQNSFVPSDKYILDGMHGGILYENYGFGEYDYTTYANEWLELHLKWTRERHYSCAFHRVSPLL